MGALANLPTLAEAQQTRRAVPKHAMTSRLDAKTAADKDDAKLLREWAKFVRLRDGGKCRVCKVKTVTTLELHPRRGEAHHLRPRSCLVTRTDVRNGIWVCLSCHQKLTKHQLFPLGQGPDALFTAGRTKARFLNGASLQLTFVAKKPG